MANNLVSYWKLIANSNDFGPNALNLTDHSVTYKQGRLGGAAYYAGAITNYSDVSDSSPLNAVSITEMFWVQHAVPAGTNVYVFKLYSNPTSTADVALYILSNTTLYGTYYTTTALNTTKAFVPVVGRWYHLAFKNDPSTGAYLYINGVQVNFNAVSKGNLHQGTTYYSVGAKNKGNAVDSPLNGSVCDIRWYNTALSDQFIKTIYSSQCGIF